MSDPPPNLNSERHSLRNYGAIKPVEGEGARSRRRQIGLISAIFIIFNRIVGAG